MDRRDDPQILNRQAGRVEQGPPRLGRGAPARRRAARRRSGPRRCASHPPRRPAPDSSPPALACSQSSQKSRQWRIALVSTSRLPCASAPSTARCWPGRRSEPRITGASPGVQVTTTGCSTASSREPARQPSSAASVPATSARRSWQTPGPKPAAARQRPAQVPLTPQADQPHRCARRGRQGDTPTGRQPPRCEAR